MEYAAHFTEDGRLQTVKEHLISVAEKGKRDSELINMPSLYYLAAILHDMVKTLLAAMNIKGQLVQVVSGTKVRLYIQIVAEDIYTKNL